MLADALLTKGSIKEQLMNSERLNESLVKLEEAAWDMAEMTSTADKILLFKPLDNLEQPILGTMEESHRVVAADYSGMCQFDLISSHIFYLCQQMLQNCTNATLLLQYRSTIHLAMLCM